MCNFYKTMNGFFFNLAKFIFPTSILTFFGGIIYVIFLALFDENTASTIDFNDIALFTVLTILPFIMSIKILEKFEPDFLKGSKINKENK